ncbi:hypothetical protein ABFX02_14G036100 [Erythranthe guttata]
MKNSFIFILFLYLVHMSESGSALSQHKIHIYNQLPTNVIPLRFHCFSKDYFSGSVTILTGQSFNLSFASNLVRNNRYACHFSCGDRHADFDVFNVAWKNLHRTYNYVVMSDGFYVNYDANDHMNNLERVASWYFG